MKNYELIDYCRRRDSEVCNECEYFDNVCAAFKKMTGVIPYFADKKDYTDEVIEVSDGK